MVTHQPGRPQEQQGLSTFFDNLYPRDDQTDNQDPFCPVHLLDYQLERHFHFPFGGHVRTTTELETWTDWTTQTLLLTLDFHLVRETM